MLEFSNESVFAVLGNRSHDVSFGSESDRRFTSVISFYYFIPHQIQLIIKMTFLFRKTSAVINIVGEYHVLHCPVSYKEKQRKVKNVQTRFAALHHI